MMQLFIARDDANSRWLMAWMIHHLVGDNTSTQWFAQEVQAHLSNQQTQLPPVQPYRNFIAQLQIAGRSSDYRTFFGNLLADVDEPTAPFGLTDAHGDGGAIEEAGEFLDLQLALRIRQCCRSLGINTASIFHVAWARVLAAASGQDSPVFGTVVFGRMHGSAGVERVMGPFINTLPVRIGLDGVSVRECVRQTHEMLAQLLMHEHASLAEVQKCARLPAGAPLFTALLNYRHSLNDDFGSVPSMQYLSSEERTNYPLTLSVDDRGNGFELNVQVSPGVGPERVCAMLRRALGELVAALGQQPEKSVLELEVLPPAEIETLLVGWNGIAAVGSKDGFVHQRFEERVRETPGAVALVFEDQQLTYEELNTRGNRLAHQLRSLGVGPDCRVALCLERSLEMVVAVLGILKAGGAYVPLDPALPDERMAFMLRDCQASVLVTQAHLAARMSHATVSLVLLDQSEPGAGCEDNLDPMAWV